MPYRDTEVEGYLAGRTIAEVDSTEAASLALANATPLPGNGYKLPMARNIVRRALSHLLGNALGRRGNRPSSPRVR